LVPLTLTVSLRESTCIVHILTLLQT